MAPSRRVTLLASLIAATVAACTSIAGLDGDYVLGQGGAGQTAQSSAASMGGTADGGSSAGGSGPVGGGGGAGSALDDSDLFARYWIDEAASGSASGSLDDAAPNPQPLALSGTTFEWIEPAPGRRALLWPDLSTGQASVAVVGNKFAQLWGRTNLTVEIVLTHSGAPSWHARLFHLGDDSTAATLQLSRVGSDLYFYMNDLAFYVWAGRQLDQRVVVHFVLDTTLAESERARLYENGSAVAPTSGAAPPANETLVEEPDPLPDYFVIGNTDTGTRPWIGAVHYLAIYTATLTPERVAQHAAILSAADDAP